MMIDTHCHLSENDYNNLNLVINHMGNNIMVASGADMAYNKEVLKLVDKFTNIYGTIGLHPDEANTYDDSDLVYIEKNLSNKKIVGIGEIGLDYHIHADNKDKQKELFIKQLDLAKKYDMTVVIHSRDAAQDTYNILKKYYGLKMIMHCYSYSLAMAYDFIKLGMYLSIGGVVTFKNGRKLQEVVKSISLDNLLLETDSPCLSPEPYRGQTNEPCNVSLVAAKIAEIKGISIDEVYKKTTENALEIYSKIGK